MVVTRCLTQKQSLRAQIGSPSLPPPARTLHLRRRDEKEMTMNAHGEVKVGQTKNVRPETRNLQEQPAKRVHQHPRRGRHNKVSSVHQTTMISRIHHPAVNHNSNQTVYHQAHRSATGRNAKATSGLRRERRKMTTWLMARGQEGNAARNRPREIMQALQRRKGRTQ